MWKTTSKWAALIVVLASAAACGSDASPDTDAGEGPPGAQDGSRAIEASSHPDDPLDGGALSPESATSDGNVTPGRDGAATRPDGGGGDSGGCGAVEAMHPSEGNVHLNLCSPTRYGTNPPSSGNHYGVWAAYRTYATTFLPGFWVHNLEHGAVVITYNCPGGCAAEVAAAQELIDALPADCPAPVRRRIVMLPDPALDVRFAASAWGYTLRANCFDRAAFADFIAAHYGHGLEEVCSDGADPLTGFNGQPYCPQ